MRFTYIDVNFDITCESHQNWSKILSMHILRGFGAHHMWHQNWHHYGKLALCSLKKYSTNLNSTSPFYRSTWQCVLGEDQTFLVLIMSSSLIEIGPKLDWTRDQMYDRFKSWKKRVEMVMDSALNEETDYAKCNYLKLWMGEEGLPLIKYDVEGDDAATGHTLKTYWDLLVKESKPKANTVNVPNTVHAHKTNF